jgi:hypothetical protein
MEVALAASSITARQIDRRTLLKAGGAGLAALALLKAPGLGGATNTAHAATSGAAPGPLAWVWRFKEDGDPEAVRSLLAAHGVGVLLKVFDGTSWMARYDKNSPMPMSGPAAVRAAADFFEAGGVPFHAWGVPNGHDPFYEAQLASQVLDAGARTFTWDLELPEGTNYWQATANEARILGEEMRRLQPNAYISVAPDARPWQVRKLPMAEFAAFCNDICPQTYWHIFDTPANHRMLAESGFPVGADGTTPEHMLNVTAATLAQYGKPIRPIGQGNSDAGWWTRFSNHAASLGMTNLSTWRVGNTAGDVWPVLAATDTTKLAVAPAPEPKAEAIEVREPATEQPANQQAASSEITPPLRDDGAGIKETLSASKTSETSSIRSKGSSEWHNKLADRLKNHRPFGIGGPR